MSGSSSEKEGAGYIYANLENRGKNIGHAMMGPIQECYMTKGSDCTVKLRPAIVYGQLVRLHVVITDKMGQPWSEGPLHYRGRGRPAWRDYITVAEARDNNAHLIIAIARGAEELSACGFVHARVSFVQPPSSPPREDPQGAPQILHLFHPSNVIQTPQNPTAAEGSMFVSWDSVLQ
uniref:Uncharacterized protein n=1 Tax=Knipowitschia caucasica TaxID=637954 RepID=A0AAV2K5C8_KNICA